MKKKIITRVCSCGFKGEGKFFNRTFNGSKYVNECLVCEVVKEVTLQNQLSKSTQRNVANYSGRIKRLMERNVEAALILRNVGRAKKILAKALVDFKRQMKYDQVLQQKAKKKPTKK